MHVKCVEFGRVRSVRVIHRQNIHAPGRTAGLKGKVGRREEWTAYGRDRRLNPWVDSQVQRTRAAAVRLLASHHSTLVDVSAGESREG